MENWRDIANFEGYQASDYGRIRSFTNNRHGICDNWHLLKPQPNHKGYYTVCLGRGNRRLVHRLVAEAFIPNPDNLPLVRHMDDNPKNNRADNLQWGAQKDNMQDCVQHGRLVRDTRAAIESKKKKVIAISKEDGRRIAFDSLSDAARELDLWTQHISSVLKGRIFQTGGWKFIYEEDGEDHV